MRDLSKRVRVLGLIVVLVGSGACLVPNPWLLVDEEIGSETRGHADDGTEETGTSGDGQTETSGMTVGDGDGDGVACGDGVVDDGEECDDANSDSDDGCLANCTVHGAVSFGSPDDLGPTTSYAAEGSQIQCPNCQHPFAANDQIYTLSQPSAQFRIGWGERNNNQWEGWYPWYAGTIYVR